MALFLKTLIYCILLSSQYTFAKDYLFSENQFHSHKRWAKVTSSDEGNLKILLKKLATSKTGREIIKRANIKAQSYGETLYDVIKKGHGSLTDTTLIRKFSASNPEHVVYESKSKVYLNKELTQYDALMDLAHELTHFVHRKDFNPYELNFSLSGFIKDTIEGVGGEAHAFLTECRVQEELFGGIEKLRGNCKKALDPSTLKISKEKITKNFYKVGSYFKQFKGLLGRYDIQKDFPSVSRETTKFVSSAYGIPYPVAALKEYLTVLGKVCDNDLKRMGYIKKSSSSGRLPASVVESMESSHKSRCKLLDK